MTNRLSLVAVLAALTPLACYTGADPEAGGLGVPADSQDGASSPEPDDDDADDPNEPNDDDVDPSDDEPEPAEDPFEVPSHEVRLLPYGVRITNLASILGVEEDHFLLDEIHVRRTILGDHDFANGVAPDLSWSPTKMSAWVKGLKPICNSALWLQLYPNLSADPAPLLRIVLAREPDADEIAAYQALATSAETTASADELTCFAALSSLDFVAQ